MHLDVDDKRRYKKRAGKTSGVEQMAFPVRPTHKHLYPRVPLEEYILWTNQKGDSFDPWIRVHVKGGGKMISVCPASMTIQGKVHEWQDWTGMEFKHSGRYLIEDALSPVFINLEEDFGEYIEPNVWIIHQT